MINYRISKELSKFIGNDDNSKIIMKYVDSIVSGIDIKPGMLKNVEDLGYMRYGIEGKDVIKRYRKCRITFFNTESLSYFDERLSNWISDYYTVSRTLSDQGIEPTSFFEFYVDTDKEVVRIANQFYLNPYRFISSMESKKNNVVSL